MAAESKYESRFVAEAEKLCKLGATEPQVAEFFGVGRRTLFNWKQSHPEFAAAVKVGKDHADERVVQSLYQRATGYSFDTEEIFCNQGEVTRVPCVKHVPPDTTSCIFWLKNRRPEDWRDVKAVEHSGAIKHEHIQELSTAELERIAASGSAGTAAKKVSKQNGTKVH